MRKVVFAKFSKERREEYQIMTQVMEGDPRRLLKKAASPKAVGHIQKLEASCRILQEEYKDNKEVVICPCSLVEEGTAEFSYIEGESMEERLEKCINQQDWEGLLEEIRLLDRIVSGVRHAGEFVRTDSFDAIFGEVLLPEGMRAGAVSNVDIIPTNLIFRNQYYMIDYEWVFDFPGPFSFILFRALFHSVEISKLPREMIDKVYDTVHISEEERKLYLEMEISLQRYITGEYTVLGELYRRMDRQCYMLRELDTQNVFTRVRLPAEKEMPGEAEELFNYRTKDKEISLNIPLQNTGIQRLFLYPEEKSCILELTEVAARTGDDWTPISLEQHNGALVRENCIYFLDKPFMIIENEDYDEVGVKYRIIFKTAEDAKRMSELVLNIRHLQNKIKEMENTKVWKAYRKYKDMREK